MNRLRRYLLSLLVGGGVASIAAASEGPQGVVIGTFVLYAFGASIFLRYPGAVYGSREGSAPDDAAWLGMALCGLTGGLNVLQFHSTLPDGPLTIFVSGLFALGVGLGYWAAAEDL